jgi:hypothetical protein
MGLGKWLDQIGESLKEGEKKKKRDTSPLQAVKDAASPTSTVGQIAGREKKVRDAIEEQTK